MEGTTLAWRKPQSITATHHRVVANVNTVFAIVPLTFSNFFKILCKFRLMTIIANEYWSGLCGVTHSCVGSEAGTVGYRWRGYHVGETDGMTSEFEKVTWRWCGMPSSPPWSSEGWLGTSRPASVERWSPQFTVYPIPTGTAHGDTLRPGRAPTRREGHHYLR